MGIVLDVIILSVLALSLILGYRKGLIGVAFNLCAFLVALIITWILYTPITNLVINNTQIVVTIISPVPGVKILCILLFSTLLSFLFSALSIAV